MQTNGHFHFSSYSFYCLLLENLSSFGHFWIFSYLGILFTSYSASFFKFLSNLLILQLSKAQFYANFSCYVSLSMTTITFYVTMYMMKVKVK